MNMGKETLYLFCAECHGDLNGLIGKFKKVGSALTPWKKKEAPESPAPVAKPAAPKPAWPDGSFPDLSPFLDSRS